MFPVLINYSIGKTKHEKKPDSADLALIRKLEDTPIKDFFPTFVLPYAHMTPMSESRSKTMECIGSTISFSHAMCLLWLRCGTWFRRTPISA